MTDHTCADCGDALDPDRDRDSAGQYRERCFPCLRDAVDAVPHVHTCECERCPVCRDHRQDPGTQVRSGRAQTTVGEW
jgi:hypothetical protein